MLFTLSTGRSGTQCLAKILETSEKVQSYHENHPMPCMHARSEARRGVYDFGVCPWGCPAEWRRHPLKGHRSALIAESRGLYSETGWGLTHYAPLIQRMGIGARWIHLVRDPRTWTLSWLADGVPVRPSHGAQVCPEGDPLHDLHWSWEPHVRSLWWWAEVHRYALTFARTADVYRLRFEDMIRGDVSGLFDWLGLDCPQDRIDEVVRTKWNHKGHKKREWDEAWDADLPLDLMAELGYEPDRL